jgi:FKBP-type peptidyl-prolyl cis-trans isomerase SlyD
MTLLIGENSVVSMHYTLKDTDGNVIDSSAGAEPLTYLHGAGNIIPGLEKALVGKTLGDSMDVTVEPAEGYGEMVPDLIQVIDKSAFQDVEAIEPDMEFQAQAPDGSLRRIVVRAVEGDEVTIDGNHPLAGMDLHFAVEITAVREATPEEIEHGHAH